GIDNLPLMILGQWCSTDNGSCVMYNFQANSNFEITLKGDSETYRGVYTCVGNHVSASYHGSQGFEWNVTSAQTYFVRYKVDGDKTEKMLHRIVGELVMHPDETVSIESQAMIPGIAVSQYTVEDSNIAKIDSKTHKITAIAPGETFVTLVTEFGTPMIHVVVGNNIIEPN
ncbi:MAG: hypothetical protein K2L93_09320, partial [Muribaculaceae bacterium]|nr:hypothetical protein [Muribaculaceae bacterium]